MTVDVFTTLRRSGKNNWMKDVLMINDARRSYWHRRYHGWRKLHGYRRYSRHCLFEAACFDGTNIRLSSKRIGLRTDASGKFEKGLRPRERIRSDATVHCQLVEELGAGEVVGGVVDVYPNPVKQTYRLPFEARQDAMRFLEQMYPKKKILEYFGQTRTWIR